MANKKNLKKHLSEIPNRPELGMEAMFGATPEIRDAAQHLLDLLPVEKRTQDEQIQWMTDVWAAARLPSPRPQPTPDKGKLVSFRLEKDWWSGSRLLARAGATVVVGQRQASEIIRLKLGQQIPCQVR